MTKHLDEAFRELASDAPAELSAPPHVMWRRGRRQRWVRRAGGAAAALVLLLTALAGLPGLLALPGPAVPAGQVARPGVSGYPQRLAHQWWVDDLPDAPGPVAGVVQVLDGDRRRWDAFTSDGTRYRLPVDETGDAVPAVSADGTRLLYPSGSDAALVFHDLRSGERRRFVLGTTDPASPSWTPSSLMPQFPNFFAPDGAEVYVTGLVPEHAPAAIGSLLGADGTVRVVPGPAQGQAYGWLDDGHLLVRTWTDGTVVEPLTQRLQSLDVHTGELRPWADFALPADLELSDGWERGQWSFLALPDGGVLRRLGGQGTDELVVRYLRDGQVFPLPQSGSLSIARADGTQVHHVLAPWLDVGTLGVGPLAWDGARALVARPADLPVPDGDPGPGLVAPGLAGEQVIATDPALGTNAFVLADDALRHGPTWTPLGTARSWPTWWWREIVLALAAAYGLFRFGSSRTRRHPAHPSTDRGLRVRGWP